MLTYLKTLLVREGAWKFRKLLWHLLWIVIFSYFTYFFRIFEILILFHLFFTVEKALQSLDDPREAVLALGLLRGLLQRLSNVKDWYSILHQKSILMAILSHCHHSLKSCSNSEVVQASLGLLLTLSKSQQGCQGLLAVDLSQVKTDLEFTSQGHR